MIETSEMGEVLHSQRVCHAGRYRGRLWRTWQQKYPTSDRDEILEGENKLVLVPVHQLGENL
jgi:hypothetical protein